MEMGWGLVGALLLLLLRLGTRYRCWCLHYRDKSIARDVLVCGYRYRQIHEYAGRDWVLA